MAVAPAAARPRPGGGRLFIIVGLLLAVLAFGAVFLIGGSSGGVVGGPNTTVIVAKQSIPLRHQITSADLDVAKAQVNGSATLSNTYSSVSDVVNLISEINISKGTVLTSDMLAKDINLVPSGSAPAYLPLAKGYVAMTIPTGEQMGVAGHISLGDYITVIVSTALTVFNQTGQQQGPTKIVSKTVFINLRVIGLGPAAAAVQPAAGGSSSSGAATSGVTSSLTVELTQCDAEYMTWFLGNTTVRYTLESFKDYSSAPTEPDPTCLTITAAGGVTQKQVDAKYHFTSL